VLAAACFAPLLKHMCILRAAENLCNLAKPFGHYSSLRSCTAQRGALCAAASGGSCQQWHRGADSPHHPSSREPPRAEATQPQSRAAGAACVSALSPMALGCSPVRPAGQALGKVGFTKGYSAHPLLTFWEARRNTDWPNVS